MEIGEKAYQALYPEVRETSDGERVTFKITSDALDRHGTVIEPGGIDFANFKRNPVVLFNHNHDRPIGRAVNIFHRGGALHAEVEFDQDDPFAKNVERKVRNKHLNGASIGFRPRERPEMEERGEEEVPVFKDTELLEFSVVSVPSNPEALVVGRDMRSRIDVLEEKIDKIIENQSVVTLDTSIVDVNGAADPAPEDTDEEAEQERSADSSASEVPDDEAAQAEPQRLIQVEMSDLRQLVQERDRARKKKARTIAKRQLGKA